MEENVLELRENGDLTNNIINKSDAHENGICHGISAVALISNGKLLIQKRSLKKEENQENGICLVLVILI